MTRALLYVYSSIDTCQETANSRPLSYSILGRIKMADHIDVEKETAEHTETRIALVTIRYTHVDFLRISVVTSCLAVLIASKSPVQEILKKNYDRQQQRQMDKTNCLTSLAHMRCVVIYSAIYFPCNTILKCI